MTEQPLTTQDLVRIWKAFIKDWEKENGTPFPSNIPNDYKHGAFATFMEWAEKQDTNPNPHRYTVDGLDTESAPELCQNPYRYPNNPDLPQELDDNGSES